MVNTSLGSYHFPMNPFLEATMPAVPRLLSLLNRNTFSPHYGSFCRDFWHYRSVTDYSAPTAQQGVLSLAILHGHRAFGEYCGNERVREYAVAGARYWASLQHDDGSFDEWYPNERSHVATAFTTFAVSEACLRLGIDDQPVRRALLKAGLWLGRHIDRSVLNHTAGAIAALANLRSMVRDSRIDEALEKNIVAMQEGQDAEGWFLENGGFDAGYLSLSLDYLARAWEITRDDRVRGMIDRGLGFLRFCVYPDGTAGGAIGNRNTGYLMPAGLLRLSPEFPAAREIAGRVAAAVSAGGAISPLTTDDRYFLFFFLPNFLDAAQLWETNPIPAASGPLFDAPGRYFPAAGLFTGRRGETTFFANLRKGGVFRYYRGARLERIDSGYFVKMPNGRILTTALLGEAEEIKKADASGILIETRFKEVNYEVPFEKLFLPFRVFNHTVGRIGELAEPSSEFIKNQFVRRRKETEFSFRREIKFRPDGAIEIEDDLTSLDSTGAEILRETSATAMHVPTSRYAGPAELSHAPERISGMVKTVLAA